MTNKSDKSLVTKVVIACSITIALFLLLFCIFSYAKYSVKGFLVPFSIMLGGYIFAIINAYKFAYSSTKDNSSRGLVIGFAVLICIFIGAHAAAGNEKVEPGSPQMENAKSIKQPWESNFETHSINDLNFEHKVL